MRSPGNENGDPAAVRKSEDQVYVALENEQHIQLH